MSLAEKSYKNLKLYNCCINKDYIDLAANRLYYSIFQAMKYVLMINEFDYGEFLLRKFPDKNRKGKSTQREYSHGSIYFAIIEVIDKKKKPHMVKDFSDLDKLYDFRILADYEDESVDKEELIEFKEKANIILEDLEQLKGA